MPRLVLLMVVILYATKSVAQYRGGSNDGYTLAGATNQNALPSIYKGGIDDGFSSATIPNQNAIPSIYKGGIDDGFSSLTIPNQNTLPTIYKGGIDDGFSSILVNAQNPTAPIYKGGIDDGFSSILVNAQNPQAPIYKGGIDDGFSSILVNAQNPLPGIYKGGVNDGWSTFIVLNVNILIPLPVRLLEFHGVWQGENVLLTWKTASETMNDHFDVERSIDNGLSFQKIGVVNGNGTINTVSNYSLLDTDVKNQPGNVFYYRLKPVATDGRFTYSAIVKLSRNEKQVSYTLYPNPGDGHFSVQVKGVNTLKGYSYQIFSGTGAALQSGLLQNTTTQFDLSRLPAATYWIRIMKDGKPETTIKIILIK